MKTFEAFFPDLLPLVPGCPEPTAKLALRRASQRFCELTLAWRAKMDPIYLTAGIDEYDLSLDTSAELVRIEKAFIGDREVKVLTPNEHISRHHTYIECADRKTVFVNPAPANTTDLLLNITASLKPSNAAQGVEDFIFDEYVAVIALGASGLLKQHPTKTYSAADGREVWAEFEGRCSSIKLAKWRGFGRNTPRTRPSFF